VHHEPPTSFALLAVVFCLRFAQAFFLYYLFFQSSSIIKSREGFL